MPLISISAAERSIFLKHISSSDPSSSATPLRHTQYLRLKGKFRYVRSGRLGAEGGERLICIELIFCFICRFWRLGRTGLKAGGGGVCAVWRSHVGCFTRRLHTCMTRFRDTHIRVRAGRLSYKHTHTRSTRRSC